MNDQIREIRMLMAQGPPPRPPKKRLASERRKFHRWLANTSPFEWHEIELEVDGLEDPWLALELYKAMVDLQPDCVAYDVYLADAWLATGNTEEALQVATRAHRKAPACTETQALILDILFATGRSEKDFEWLEPPTVIRLGPELRQRVHDRLSQLSTPSLPRGSEQTPSLPPGSEQTPSLPPGSEQTPCDLGDLRIHLFADEYLLFSESDLARHLESDARFEVFGDGIFWAVGLRRSC